MRIEILGCESMGVQSLCTYVETISHKILIDPGLTLVPYRDNLKPHPYEIAASRAARDKMVERARVADRLVVTHYHHDHFTGKLRRPFEWIQPALFDRLYRKKTVYAKSERLQINPAQKKRAFHLFRRRDGFFIEADGKSFEEIHFTEALPHGEKGTPRGWVVAVCVHEGEKRFVFASDIQCVEEESIDRLLAFRPTTLLASGPAVGQPEFAPYEARAKANALRLAEAVPTLILDHHMLRAQAGLDFLAELKAKAAAAGNRCLSGAEFMNRPVLLLEARRAELYKKAPVAPDWHDRFVRSDPAVHREIEELSHALLRADSFFFENLGVLAA